MSTQQPKFQTGTVICDDCGAKHVAEFDHFGAYDPETPYFAVVCDVDGMTGFYAESRVAVRTS